MISFVARPTNTPNHYTGLASAGAFVPVIQLPSGALCYAFEDIQSGEFWLYHGAALMDAGNNCVGVLQAPTPVKMRAGRDVIAVGEGDVIGTIEP